MKEHVEEISNMTCVLREMKVIDQNNNIDVTAMKKDAKQYKVKTQCRLRIFSKYFPLSCPVPGLVRDTRRSSTAATRLPRTSPLACRTRSSPTTTTVP